MQSIDGLDVSRRDYVPSDDHFERTFDVFTNPGYHAHHRHRHHVEQPGLGHATRRSPGTSAGGTAISDSDEWVTTFQNWSGTTTSDPRLGHVLQTTGAAVPANNVTFADGSDHPHWSYTFTVGAGQTVIIANFAVADATIAASQADAARLAALPPTALECTTAADQSEIANMGSLPTITTQPSDQTAAAGGPASFMAAATAVGQGQSPTVQWQVSTDGGSTFTDLAGATSATLNLTSVSTAQNGDRYRAVFTNGIGSVDSTAATLTVPATGYWLADAAGGVEAVGVPSDGSLVSEGVKPAKPIVGVAATPDDQGYWLVGADGGVFAFGSAGYYGSAAPLDLAKPIVGIVGAPDGHGYWLVGADGGVFAFGSAGYYGSAAPLHLNAPIVGLAAAPDGQGYWLVGADGGVYAFGSAGFFGSGVGLDSHGITGIAANPDGQGYWLAGADGGVFAFGSATYDGGMAGTTLNKPVVGITATPDGGGYRLVGADGGVFAFGDATFSGAGSSKDATVGLADGGGAPTG